MKLLAFPHLSPTRHGLLGIISAGVLSSLAHGNEASDLVLRADAFNAKNDNWSALPLVIEADRLQPNNPEILRRLAKQYCELALDSKSKQEQKEQASTAVEYAKRAAALAPMNANVRLTLAICYARMTLACDARQKVEYSRLIQSEALKAVELDPKSNFAYHLLGCWNYEIANMNGGLKAIVRWVYGGLPPASNQQAVDYFKKAIALAPQSVLHHVELGRTYAALGDDRLAREDLNKGISLPSVEKDDAAAKERARIVLNQL